MGLDFVYVMDPIERIDIDADSTFVLMLEAQKRGHRVLYGQMNQLALRGGDPVMSVQPATLQRKRGDHVALGERETVRLSQCDAVFMRKDPPFDVDFLLATLLLDRVDHDRVVMVNRPQTLRDFNEKLAALYWPELMPPTMISADRAEIRAFIAEHGRAVVKPLSGAGGAGVLLLEHGDRNIGSVLDLLTVEGRRLIEVQGFIEAVQEGDKRVILLEGEPIGAVNRVPQKGDLRANMHVGGSAQPTELTDRDREIAAALAPEMKKRGLVFVGIDVIGGYLTEVNVTSPTGLQEIDRFDGVCLEGQIIDWVEARHAELRKA
ncbi:MAG: glutathione synthase [Deltaproteobacteria bacterium]|jgi:glutathione synthase